MNYQKAIAYLKNTIEFNDLEFGSVRQLSEVIKFLEAKERADYTMEGANLQHTTAPARNVSLCVGCKSVDCSQRSEVCGIVTICAMRQG